MGSRADLLPPEAAGHDPVEWQRAYERVCGLLVDHLGLAPDALSPGTRLDEDLAIDSLDLLDFGMILSDRHRTELTLDVLKLAHTLGDLTSLVVAAEGDCRASAS